MKGFRHFDKKNCNLNNRGNTKRVNLNKFIALRHKIKIRFEVFHRAFYLIVFEFSNFAVKNVVWIRRSTELFTKFKFILKYSTEHFTIAFYLNSSFSVKKKTENCIEYV